MNSIYKYYICCKFCWERLCGNLRWEWLPCAVVPKASLYRFHHGWWIWKTRGFVASYQFCLKTFDDVISLENVVDDASLWHRRIGSKMGFEERTALMSGPCLEERLEVETDRVHVNKACSLNGPCVSVAWICHKPIKPNPAIHWPNTSCIRNPTQLTLHKVIYIYIYILNYVWLKKNGIDLIKIPINLVSSRMRENREERGS